MNNTTIDTRTAEFRLPLDGEANWLYQQRKLAWESYATMPLPDRVKHLWRYTDPRVFVPTEEFDSAAITGSLEGDLPAEATDAGVQLLELEEAADTHADLLQQHLGSLVGPTFDTFEAFNFAASRLGWVLIIPDNAEFEAPIHLRRSTDGGLFATRLLVIAGKNAEVSIVDEYTGESGIHGQINSVVEVIAKDAARVKFATTVNLPDNQTLFLTQRNKVGRDVDLQSTGLSLNAGIAKINWSTLLSGRGASSRWSGLLLGDKEQHFDMHTRHQHTSGESFSDLLYKVALRDSSMSAYTGLIAIDEDAAICEAYQENRNLLLSDTAHVESIPELEIVNDDVKCSHGVTVGPLEEEQLFYFESRGINRDEAMRIILAGYYEAVLERLPKGYVETGREALLNKLMGDSRHGG